MNFPQVSCLNYTKCVTTTKLILWGKFNFGVYRCCKCSTNLITRNDVIRNAKSRDRPEMCERPGQVNNLAPLKTGIIETFSVQVRAGGISEGTRPNCGSF